MLPNANGAVVTILGADVGRPRAGDDQLHGRRRQHPRRLQGGARSTPSSPRAPSSRRASSTTWSPQLEQEVKIVYLEDVRADRHASATSCAACSAPRSRWSRASPTTGPRSCSPRARRARRRASCCPTATCWPTPRRRRRASTSAAQDKVFNVLPVFHSFGLTVGMMLPLVSGVPHLSLSLAAALPHRAGADLRRERHHPVRHRHVPRRLCARRRTPTTSARCATSWPAPSR